MSSKNLTWEALAAAIKVPVRKLHSDRHLAEAPKDKDVEAWREYYLGKSFLDVDGLTPTTYDARLKTGAIALDDALVHARLVEQEIINERRREELKRARGETVSRDEARESVKRLAAAVLLILGEIPDLAAAAAAPADKAGARLQAKGWVDLIRTKVSEKLRDGQAPGENNE